MHAMKVYKPGTSDQSIATVKAKSHSTFNIVFSLWVVVFVYIVLPLWYDTFEKRKKIVLSRCRLLVNMTNGLKLSYYQGNTKYKQFELQNIYNEFKQYRLYEIIYEIKRSEVKYFREIHRIYLK